VISPSFERCATLVITCSIVLAQALWSVVVGILLWRFRGR